MRVVAALDEVRHPADARLRRDELQLRVRAQDAAEEEVRNDLHVRGRRHADEHLCRRAGRVSHCCEAGVQSAPSGAHRTHELEGRRSGENAREIQAGLKFQASTDEIELTRTNRRLRYELGDRYRIIGESVPMKALRQQLALAAPTQGRILIYGESGTGKELVAHALHRMSPRADRAFVEVNCAAIPEELIESELFGHVKGSFTGAVEDKVGKFEQADAGTLFLDEVGDMSLRTQSKVLRVIEEQRFQPVGSGKDLSVDVRVLAATNKNLEAEIQKGNFREDLFYRLNVIPFFAPPLREHAEDVPALADYFLAEFARAYGRRPKHFSESALGALERYRWPGNVRELRNLVERMVIMVAGDRIELRHLPPGFHHERTAAGGAVSGGFSNLQEARAAYERDYILRRLEENHGNVSRTAEVLGLERSHLYRKMKSLGIAAGE